MLCNSCHMENADGSKFCAGCGRPLLSEEVKNIEPVPVQFQDQVQDYQVNTYSVQQTNSQPNYQSDYQQPYSSQNQQPNIYINNSVPNNVDEHVSVGGWIGRMCINLIPFVGPIIYFIMLFVWAFGNNPKKSLKTFAQANLIFYAIVIGIVIIVAIIMGVMGLSIANSIQQSARNSSTYGYRYY